MTLALDPDRQLALAYVPVRARLAMEALWRLDVSLGSVLVSGRDALISQIRLAWWRESLEKLDRQKPPAEPVLKAVAEHVIPSGISGESLSELEQGWAVLLSPAPLNADEIALYAGGRGALLFQLSARLLGEEPAFVATAGKRWALVDLARHSGEPDAASAMNAARAIPADPKWPAILRPLGMLSVLAFGDAQSDEALARQGSPGRMLRMLGHRLTGR